MAWLFFCTSLFNIVFLTVILIIAHPLWNTYLKPILLTIFGVLLKVWFNNRWLVQFDAPLHWFAALISSRWHTMYMYMCMVESLYKRHLGISGSVRCPLFRDRKFIILWQRQVSLFDIGLSSYIYVYLLKHNKYFLETERFSLRAFFSSKMKCLYSGITLQPFLLALL